MWLLDVETLKGGPNRTGKHNIRNVKSYVLTTDDGCLIKFDSIISSIKDPVRYQDISLYFKMFKVFKVIGGPKILEVPKRTIFIQKGLAQR